MGLDYPWEKFAMAVYDLATMPDRIGVRLRWAYRDKLIATRPFSADLPDPEVQRELNSVLDALAEADFDDEDLCVELAKRIHEASSSLDDLWNKQWARESE